MMNMGGISLRNDETDELLTEYTRIVQNRKAFMLNAWTLVEAAKTAGRNDLHSDCERFMNEEMLALVEKDGGNHSYIGTHENEFDRRVELGYQQFLKQKFESQEFKDAIKICKDLVAGTSDHCVAFRKKLSN